MINGHVVCNHILSLEFDLCHNCIANEYKSFELYVYIKGDSADNHTLFHMFISIYKQDWCAAEV